MAVCDVVALGLREALDPAAHAEPDPQERPSRDSPVCPNSIKGKKQNGLSKPG